ncbi:glycoside hydrolase family 3 N-terminal domain-containing protein [Terrimonas rubra]|uniref:beta-glucosidase n=1 Tax=Terrimonas rubra TaxID=1035890 RepID=A0ABW6A926_9BACT
MKKLILFFLGTIVMSATIPAQTAAEISAAKALVKKMTLEEKAGQMTQITLALIAKGGWGNEDGALDPAALKKIVTEHHIGSILNTTAHALPVDTWVKLITQIQDEAQNTRLKIPVIYGLDAIHGQTYTLDATLFPHNIAIAATRDPEYARQAAKVTANELRASGVRWNFAPVLDIGRQPLWSRFAETYGEDVHMVTQFGVAAIKGYEEDGLKNTTAVASCMKHYLGYAASRTGKDRTPIYLPEIELRELHLPQFRAAVKAGSASIMINSSEINGIPVHADKYLLTDVLRKELGFQGVVVTDWEDIIRLHTIHHVAPTPLDAVVMSINAGVDMSMVPSDLSFYSLLIEAVNKKLIPISRVDDAVLRILLMKYKLGLFDNPYPEKEAIQNFGKPAYQVLALEAAREAITLLKNDQVLPLSKEAKVLVAGPSAQSLAALNGAWSYTWQGNDDRWYPKDSKTILQAIKEKIGADKVVTTTGPGFTNALNDDAESLKKAAAGVDAIVLCIGENAYAESPGNIRDLALPDNQKLLVETAILTGKPVILVLTEGRPLFITDYAPSVKGIVMTYWSGKKTAEALADILWGDHNPSGRLPFSYPKSMGEIVMYDRKGTEEKREILNENVSWDGYDPLFPFGHGLSYTGFAYKNLKVSNKTLQAGQKITITVDITNTGNRDGKHAVELYSRDLYASITPSMRRLRAFTKIFLKAGETKTVSFTITPADLAFVNATLKTVTEPGDFELYIGDQKTTITYQ